MRKTLLIAAREYKAAVRTKSFIVSLLLMPALMGGSAAIQTIFRQHADTEDKRIAVVDRTPGSKVAGMLLEAARFRNSSAIYDPETKKQVRAVFTLISLPASANSPEAISLQRLDLSERIRQEEFFGFLEIGPDVCKLAPGAGSGAAEDENECFYIRYQTDHPTYLAFPRWAEAQVNMAILKERWTSAGLSPEKMASVLQPVALDTKGLSQRDPLTGEIGDPPVVQLAARFIVPAGLVVLMFVVVMLGSTPAMQGVVEEKMQRIAEVLLGSCRPFELMLGKLLGTVSVSLTVAATYLLAALWAAHHFGVDAFLPPSLIVWFVVFQILAVLMYGSLFLAIGAAASDIKETQTLVLPIVLLACLPMFILMTAIEEPNNSLVTWLSFFPPVSPMLMIARQAVPPGIAWWQPVLAVTIVITVTAICVYMAGRIFRIGILMQGKGPRIGQLIRWAIRG